MEYRKFINAQREKRHFRVRKDVHGTPERPRLSVYRGHRHIHCQIIDDSASKTLVAVSSLSKDLREQLKHGGNITAAKVIGKAIADAAIKKGIKKVVFDKSWYRFHGRVKALAEAARAAGLQF
jgi:large subunit ribosomal protein L18